MPRHLTEITKARVITKLEDGWSIRAVAREFHLNKHTVFKIKKRWEQEGTLRRKVGSGRPKISNNVEDLRLIIYLEENPFKTDW
jgi:transposase